MKTNLQLRVMLTLCLVALSPGAFAQLTIPGADGSDGVLNVTSNTVIDLSQAISGTWSNNNSANAGKGIYDSNKWAVVFKYSSVNIASNVTVSFKNHAAHAPVVWLVSGNMTVNGVLDLNGQSWNQDLIYRTEPGPGGFRGGAAYEAGLDHGSGFGPGGYYNTVGGYANYHAYGNSQIIPLIGGSGGSGGTTRQGNGGAGGGSMLIAATGTTTINGTCRANGGDGTDGGCCGDFYAFAGSGGAIRIISNVLLGSGRIEAAGGAYSGGGDSGRIRLEANFGSDFLSVNPPTTVISPSPLIIWPAANTPTVSVVSVDGKTTPVDPRARIGSGAADLVTANLAAVSIILQTTSFPTNGTVNVYLKPRNAAQSILQAIFVSGDTNTALWQVTTTFPVYHTVIQARAVSN